MEETLFVENNKPLVFGAEGQKGVKLDGFTPVVVDINESNTLNDLWVHDETDRVKAGILARFFDDPSTKPEHFPRPFGVFYTEDRPCYEDELHVQVAKATEMKKKGDLDSLIRGKEVWEIH